MRRLFTIIVLLMIFAMLGVVVWVSNQLGSIKHPKDSKTPVGNERHLPAPPPAQKTE